MQILVTNDDGLSCRGIHVLRDIAEEFGDVVVVAPDRDRSGVSNAITLNEPLRLRSAGDSRCFQLSGTPTDCVYVGIHKVLRDTPIDLVLSGINPGPNLGWDTLYSGTVAAAREGVLQGIRSMAFSLLPADEMPYDEIRPWIHQVIQRSLKWSPAPFTVLNVNIPNPRKGPLKGIVATEVGQRYYSKEVVERNDPRGKEYLWIGGDDVTMPNIEGSDCNAIREGMVSVTPLTCNHTATNCLSDVRTVMNTNTPLEG